ncbi:MAG: spore cortex biosynthesis protein YabQ [Sedimentibacter sp.]|uniref:spore cortex biosynthesis protein YabQ n=1 Tax=Sedimentibacter sp. TaxID=1960295 RepID=UPI002980B709|nr:spore cortex biosynthesis protein YabQ [Sedimentibacter sp.]MDW5298663.1 spore cortex biosynthesis protein YabQ [Sedimentibacter sp.]
MDFLPYSQEYMLAVSIMGGMLLGFVWDIYRLVRHYVKMGTIGIALGDLIYWIISIYFSIQLILDISYGNVRMFILMGFMLGAFLYFYGLSSYFLKVFIRIIDLILKVVKKIIFFLIEPIKYIIELLKGILYPLKLKYDKLRNKAKKRYKFFKFRLKKVSKNRKLIYNKNKSKRRKNGKNKGRKEQKLIG